MQEESTPDFARNIELPLEVETILRTIAAKGGRALIVGGYVRDLARGATSKDLDIEVHRMTLEQLETMLSRFGPVDLVGKQFGVLRLHGSDVDWSIPRKDSKGRHPVVVPDPWMGIQDAARRRDLTVNAMALDPLDGVLFDPFGGLDDLKRGVLRATALDLFAEVPLRYYRVMGFAGRFEMAVDPELTRLCGGMDLNGVAGERIEEEFTRLFLRSRRPSLGLRWIKTTGRLQEIMPEAAALVGLEQDPQWHPEGDVWTHTLQVLDAAVQLRIEDRDPDLMLLWAALCHDLGKAGTTAVIEGRIRSPGHSELSRELAGSFLDRLIKNACVREGAIKLSAHHLKPCDFYVNKAGPRAFKRLAVALVPETSLERLAAFSLADFRGRNPDGDEPLEITCEKSAWFLEQAEAFHVKEEPEKPVLMGRHLLDVMQPGPEMGQVLRRAYEIQISEELRDVNELKTRVLEEPGLSGNIPPE